MKKAAFLLLFCTFSLSVMAQTNSDDFSSIGVVTGWEKYTGNRNELYGVTFTNNNFFPIIVDAELWTFVMFSVSNVHSYISNTSSFMLNPGEKYVWKIGASSYSEANGFQVSSAPAYSYVKYKAYRKQ